MPASAYSTGLVKRSCLRLPFDSTSTTSATCSGSAHIACPGEPGASTVTSGMTRLSPIWMPISRTGRQPAGAADLRNRSDLVRELVVADACRGSHVQRSLDLVPVAVLGQLEQVVDGERAI